MIEVNRAYANFVEMHASRIFVLCACFWILASARINLGVYQFSLGIQKFYVGTYKFIYLVNIAQLDSRLFYSSNANSFFYYELTSIFNQVVVNVDV